jgi:hypothetical protein
MDLMDTSNSEIDPSRVQWDVGSIDPAKVQWDPPASRLQTNNPMGTGYQSSPTAGMSGYDEFMAGAGKAPVDLWHGVKQLFGQESSADADERAALDRPLMHTGAGVAGNIAGNIAESVVPAGLAADAARGVGLVRTGAALSALANPGTYGAAAASGAVQGALQPVESQGSRLWNTGAGALGGVAGNAIGRGVGAAASAVAGTIEDASSRAVQALKDAGVPLDAAQRTGSILLQRAKAMLSDNPLTAGAQRDFQDMQGRAITKAFLRTVGSDADSATPDVMGATMKRLGASYDDAFSKLPLPYDKIEAPLSALVDNARLHLNDQQFGIIHRNADDVLNKAAANGGVISGPQFQNLKSNLDRISGGQDQQVGDVARDLREVLHNGLLQHASDTGNSAVAEQLQQTNQQWRNMRTIESAISKDGSGTINPSTVATVMAQKRNRSVSIYGQGDTTLSDLAQAANALLPSKTAQSGTIPRLAAQMVLPGAVAAGEGLYSGDWKKAAEYGAAGVALPKAAQYLINAQGPVARAASSAVGTLAKPSRLSGLFGGAVQHAPTSGLLSEQLGLEDSPDKRKPGSTN